jgi:hypothetical protein
MPIALYVLHTKNQDLTSSLYLGISDTGVYSNWVILNPIIGQCEGSLGWLINTYTIDTRTGVMLGIIISATTGTNGNIR